MSLSSFCVVTNALRLNLFDIRSTAHDRRGKPAALTTETEKEETKMDERVMTIEGMMCVHCEARVKKALEALEEVDHAEVSHEKGTAVVTLKADIDNEKLKKAVEDQDYSVTGIRD